jgi:hypothetical protein
MESVAHYTRTQKEENRLPEISESLGFPSSGHIPRSTNEWTPLPKRHVVCKCIVAVRIKKAQQTPGGFNRFSAAHESVNI